MLRSVVGRIDVLVVETPDEGPSDPIPDCPHAEIRNAIETNAKALTAF
jgi:hypothetical protein